MTAFVPKRNCTNLSGGCFTAGACLGGCGTTAAQVKLLKQPSPMPADVPDRLRQLAADVESGRVTALVIGLVCDDNYEFVWPSSLNESLLIATLLQASALDRLRR